jgi:hypothetical protein
LPIDQRGFAPCSLPASRKNVTLRNVGFQTKLDAFSEVEMMRICDRENSVAFHELLGFKLIAKGGVHPALLVRGGA